MPISAGQLSLLRVARSQLKLSNTAFRRLVREHGGVARVTELDELGFRSLTARLRRLGFERKGARRAHERREVAPGA